MALTCTNHPEVSDGIRQCARCQSHFCEDCLVFQSGEYLCAACKEIARASSTGAVGLRLASLPARAIAITVDGVLTMIVFFGSLRAGGWLDDYFAVVTQQPITFLPVLSLPHLYFMLPVWALAITYEATMLQWRSQTLGKMLMRIKVIDTQGQRITARGAWLRAAARGGAALLGVLGYIDYLAVFIGQGRATLHDRVAKTRVVAN